MAKRRKKRNGGTIFAQHPYLTVLLALGLLYWGYTTISKSRQLTSAA